jgi:transposase
MSNALMVSPPTLAKRFAVKADKILAWIRSGELPAVDLSMTPGTGKPRWKIAETDVEAFLARRAATPPAPTPRPRRRRRTATPAKEYF